jgi:hypothetical protein
LSALDALGKLYFSFTGEQRRGTHLSQINAYWVAVRLRGTRRWVEVDVL